MNAPSHSFRRWSVRRLDRVGTVLSLLCAIHCLIAPLLFAYSCYGTHVHSRGESLFLFITFWIAIISHSWGFVHHGQWKAFSSLTLAFLLIYLSRFLHPKFQVLLMVLGGITLSLSHLWNTRLCNHHHA
jgi:hypothetical protein